jgi:4-oxalocrotonate tautomerase
MPLVRIELLKGQDVRFRQQVGQIVYEAMVACINVPANDHFQVISEHDPANMVFDPGYLGIQRSDGFVLIQIFLNEGRTLEQKKALYGAIAAGLSAALKIRPEDVMINLVEMKKENWSFGNGIAQYAP